jgi:hypothetical protein
MEWINGLDTWSGPARDWISGVGVPMQILLAVAVMGAGAVLMALITGRRVWDCKASGFYLALVPFVNWSFTWAPMFPIGDTGGMLNPITILTGLVMVFRDFAQREIKNWILLLLAIGVGLTYLSAGGALAIASGAAFLISELADWIVYNTVKRPLSQRIVISSGASAPLDSFVFNWLAELIRPGIFNIWSIMASILGKMIGAVIVSAVVRAQEKRDPALAREL